MNVLEKKYTVELTDSELHILQAALCDRNQSLSEKLAAAENINCKNEVRKQYITRLERKRVACEQLLKILFDAEMRGECDE